MRVIRSRRGGRHRNGTNGQKSPTKTENRLSSRHTQYVGAPAPASPLESLGNTIKSTC